MIERLRYAATDGLQAAFGKDCRTYRDSNLRVRAGWEGGCGVRRFFMALLIGVGVTYGSLTGQFAEGGRLV